MWNPRVRAKNPEKQHFLVFWCLFTDSLACTHHCIPDPQAKCWRFTTRNKKQTNSRLLVGLLQHTFFYQNVTIRLTKLFWMKQFQLVKPLSPNPLTERDWISRIHWNVTRLYLGFFCYFVSLLRKLLQLLAKNFSLLFKMKFHNWKMVHTQTTNVLLVYYLQDWP